MGIVDDLLRFGRTAKVTQNGKSSNDVFSEKLEETCDRLKHLMETGNVGAIVGEHAKLITGYYSDVREQAHNSFASAKSVARFGFGVLIVTLL
jgi:hypothetical protein